MKRNIRLIFTILAQTLLFSSLLASMPMPKRIGVGVAFDSPNFVIPIWITDEYEIEPEFRFWSQRSSQLNNFEIVEHRRIINFGIGFFRRFSMDELSFCAGIRIDVLQDLTLEDHFGQYFNENELARTSVTFGISPAVGAEYFFHERFSLGSEIQVNIDFTNIEANYYDLEESLYSIGTNTKIYIRFYLI